MLSSVDLRRRFPNSVNTASYYILKRKNYWSKTSKIRTYKEYKQSTRKTDVLIFYGKNKENIVVYNYNTDEMF